MARKQKQQRITTRSFLVGGIMVTVPASPYCDCEKPTWSGFTKRDDGVWVRPCCMRRTKVMYDKHGDEPLTVPPREQIGAQA